MMTFREFKEWYIYHHALNHFSYAQDGICMASIGYIKTYPFWRRKKVWGSLYDESLKRIIDEINEKYFIS